MKQLIGNSLHSGKYVPKQLIYRINLVKYFISGGLLSPKLGGQTRTKGVRLWCCSSIMFWYLCCCNMLADIYYSQIQYLSVFWNLKTKITKKRGRKRWYIFEVFWIGTYDPTPSFPKISTQIFEMDRKAKHRKIHSLNLKIENRNRVSRLGLDLGLLIF